MAKFSSIYEIEEAIEEAQGKAAEFESQISGVDMGARDFCEDECNEDCTDCTQAVVDEWAEKQQEHEDTVNELQSLREKLLENEDEKVVDYFLDTNKGDTEAVLKIVHDKDYSIYTDSDEYIDMMLDNWDCDEFLKDFIDRDRLLETLLSGENYDCIGDWYIIFF